MQVLLTAIGIPRPREDAVLWSRLMNALREGLSRRHLLVAAEAGYGKATRPRTRPARGSAVGVSGDRGDPLRAAPGVNHNRRPGSPETTALFETIAGSR